MREWISIFIDQNGIENYKDFGLGININIHKHAYGTGKDNLFPFHFHICLTVAFWFIELQIGRDVIERDEK